MGVPERAAERQGGTCPGAARRPRRVGCRRGPGRPGRDPRTAGGAQGAGAAADPLRADGGLVVHLLPRRRGGDGRRPRHDPDLGPAGPDVRRRPSLQLRRLRRSRPAAGLRPQRLRRDAAGAVGVGRQAARGELRDRRPRQRLQAQRSNRGGGDGRRAPTARRSASSRNCAISRSGTRGSTPSRCCSRSGRAPEVGEKSREGGGEGAREGQPAGPGPPHPHGRWRASDHQQTAAHRARRGDRGRRRLRLRGGDPQGPGRIHATP